MKVPEKPASSEAAKWSEVVTVSLWGAGCDRGRGYNWLVDMLIGYVTCDESWWESFCFFHIYFYVSKERYLSNTHLSNCFFCVYSAFNGWICLSFFSKNTEYLCVFCPLHGWLFYPFRLTRGKDASPGGSNFTNFKCGCAIIMVIRCQSPHSIGVDIYIFLYLQYIYI